MAFMNFISLLSGRISLSCILFFITCLFSHKHTSLALDQSSSNSLENSPISHYEAIVGDDILLPCDATPPSHDDASILVLFYRGENKTPIYSVDSRDSSLESGMHWSATYLGSRAYLKTSSGIQGLHLSQVELEDEGLYRCRVDFEASPTKNSRVHLRVIEPPRLMTITSNWNGERMTNDIIGPYPEGADVSLSCQVIGGIPQPKVTWWNEGSLLDDNSEVRSGGVTRNTLHLPKLKRSDLLRVITCLATNSNLTSPLSKAITIDLAYPPSAIHISSQSEDFINDPLRVPQTITCVDGQKCPLECRVDGSRPPPLVTWKSSGRTLESEFQTISSPPGVKEDSADKASSSYSTLMLAADVNDNGAVISCRAASPALPNQAIEDNVRLNVLFKPQLKLNVKDRIDLENVEENEDVEFECQVSANPEVAEIHWTRNWIPLVQNSSSGVHFSASGSNLRLMKVTRHLSGQYACAAANNRGSGTSNVLKLSVKFSPKCSPKQVDSVGIGMQESANVTCRVDAHPSATIFRWAFNSSGELVDIPFDKQIEKNDSSNAVTYMPLKFDDYGDLLCWASNSVGTMKDPCIIKVLPIDKPEGVRACKISSNASVPNGMVVVSCLPGWNGGLPQTFTLEVRTASNVHARILAALQHSPDPIFHLRNLRAGEEYLFTVTSANPRGTSPPVTLTYTSPEEVIAGLTNKHSNPQSSFMALMPFLAIFFAIVVALTTCASIMACIAKSRASEKSKQAKQAEREASIVTSRKVSSEHTIATDTRCVPYLSSDRGKDDLDDNDIVLKDPSDHYCAVHGHERRENEYISYKHYFNNMQDDLETQHLLKSSIGGSSGMDNQCNAFYNNNSRDSSGSCGLEKQTLKDSGGDYPCMSNNPRHSDGSFRGLAPLASVDSLSGFSTISNYSSASKKTENSSQKSFRPIPEMLSQNGECFPSTTRSIISTGTSTLPLPHLTHYSTLGNSSTLLVNLPSSTSNPSYRAATNFAYPSSPYNDPQSGIPSYPVMGSAQYKLSSDFPYQTKTSTYSHPAMRNSSFSPPIPSLPPPSLSSHPIFANETYKSGHSCRESNSPPTLEIPHQERKMSRESSV